MWNLERPPARMHEGQLILPGGEPDRGRGPPVQAPGQLVV